MFENITKLEKVQWDVAMGYYFHWTEWTGTGFERRLFQGDTQEFTEKYHKKAFNTLMCKA